VRSRVCEVRAQVEVTDDMMPGVVSCRNGFSGTTANDVRLGVARARQPGVNANALTDDQTLDRAVGHERGQRNPGGGLPAQLTE